jgi:hypothetical protein
MTEEREEEPKERAASLEEQQLAMRSYLAMMEKAQLVELDVRDRARLRGYVLSERMGRA